MLVVDIVGQVIDIGDTVILNDGIRNYKALLVKETASSVQYKVWIGEAGPFRDDWKFWIRKSSMNFRSMYKVC